MLYNTFTNATVNVNGAPILYMNTLTAYTPPQFQNSWKPVAGDLKNFYDLKFPYRTDHGWEAFGREGVELETGRRISLYASILQTNPETRSAGFPVDDITGEPPNGLPPEESFLSVFPSAVYWRVLGSLIFEDEINDAKGEVSRG